MQKVIWFSKDVKVVPILSSLSTHPDGGHTIQFKVEGNLTARSNSPQIEGLTDEQLRKAVADGEIKLVIVPGQRSELRSNVPGFVDDWCKEG
jgi:hypothetical protein